MKDIIQKKLDQAFPEAEILIDSYYNDIGHLHYAVTITSTKFKNLSLVDQHRLVYEALGDMMKDKIHALKLKTIPSS